MDHIDPASLGIEGMTARRAVTGAQVFEVGGPEHSQKADALAERVKEVLQDRKGCECRAPPPQLNYGSETSVKLWMRRIFPRQ